MRGFYCEGVLGHIRKSQNLLSRPFPSVEDPVGRSRLVLLYIPGGVSKAGKLPRGPSVVVEGKGCSGSDEELCQTPIESC